MNLICKTVAIEKTKVTSITSGIYVLACIWRDGSSVDTGGPTR